MITLQKIDGQFRDSSIKDYCVKFNDSWCNKFKFIQIFRKGDVFSLCTVFGSDFSVPHGEENDISRQKVTSKHNGYVDAVQHKEI